MSDMKKQAAAQVIALKKEYATRQSSQEGFHNSAAAKEISVRADTIRKEFGLDSNRYGRGATLEDAYNNFANDYGSMNDSGGRVESPQRKNTSNPNRGPDSSLEDILGMLEQSMQGGLDAQTAQFDKQLESQLANLKSQLDQAVNEGELSVREAEKMFEQQKGEIQDAAFRQSQATKHYSNDMGIQHSGASLGLRKGDEARTNKLHNTNMSDKSDRIMDIKNRLDMIKNQARRDETMFQSERDFNVGMAQGQAQQGYMQSAADLMGQNYFAQQGQQHDWDMQQEDYNFQDSKLEKEFRQQFDVLDKEQEFTRENVFTGFLNNLSLQENESTLRIAEMMQGHELKLEEIDVMFTNELEAMLQQHGFNVDLQDKSIQGQIQLARENNAARMQQIHAQSRGQSRSSTAGKVKKAQDDIFADIATNTALNNPNLPAWGSYYDSMPNKNDANYSQKKEEHMMSIRAIRDWEKATGNKYQAFQR